MWGHVLQLVQEYKKPDFITATFNTNYQWSAVISSGKENGQIQTRRTFLSVVPKCHPSENVSAEEEIKEEIIEELQEIEEEIEEKIMEMVQKLEEQAEEEIITEFREQPSASSRENHPYSPFSD